MDKIIYLCLYLYSIILSFLISPLNFISAPIANTFIGQALIYGVSVFCLINRLQKNPPRYILLAIVLGVVTINLYAFNLFYVIKIVLGAIMGYLLTKIKTTKYRIIGAIISLILFLLYHFLIVSLFRE